MQVLVWSVVFVLNCIGISIQSQAAIDNLNVLQQVHVIFRHGDRWPIKRSYGSLSPDGWPDGWSWGQLTKEGKQMQYSLGKYLRSRYDDFLSSIYTREEIFVQSSDVDRAIMSAYANLAGLFPFTPISQDSISKWSPNSNWPIPVHVISRQVDNKIAFYQSCPKYERLLSEFLQGEYIKEFDKNHTKLYHYLSEKSGLKITDHEPVADFSDMLTVASLHNITNVPEWTKQIFPAKMYPSALLWIKKFTFTDKLKIIRGGPFLTEILYNMVREANIDKDLKILHTYPPKAKMYMYSGHDNTVSAILDALGLFESHIPFYTASVIFELYKHSVTKEYTVKIFYKASLEKDAEQLIIAECETPCYLHNLLKIKSNYLITQEEWQEECNNVKDFIQCSLDSCSQIPSLYLQSNMLGESSEYL